MQGKEPQDLIEWDSIIPKMDVWLNVSKNEMQHVFDIIPTLKWSGDILGVRLAYLPNDIHKLFTDYKEAFFAVRETENSANSATDITESNDVNNGQKKLYLYPKNLSEFLEKNLNTYFSIKSYILNPAKYEEVQRTDFDLECFNSNPLKGIIKVDMINAQRGFTDPDNVGGNERTKNQLSEQMRNYYDKHLDPEKTPSVDDLNILSTMEKARVAFDENLSSKFAPAIKELEQLGYPGVADPKLTISSKISTSESLKHDAAVQYALSKTNDSLKLPEKYNGLGYQNLISIVFDLMSFRDDWMRVGKAKQVKKYSNLVIEPLHLVLIEEPEAHLHVQVQQVFIRKAYAVLTNYSSSGSNSSFATQLVISTHSSHIAREVNFADLRYFKRLTEDSETMISTSKVINLSDVFGKEDETDKFVTRYLQATHCDLFFADAVILVEGSAENMLLPHFIRNRYPSLYQRYISILSINGRHSQRLKPLIELLCIPTLIITDIDSAERSGHHKTALPERGKDLICSNYSISKWLEVEEDFDKLLDLPDDSKVIVKRTPYDYSIRVAYQTPVFINFNSESKEALASTFEDSLVYTNYDLFKKISITDTGSILKQVVDKIKTEKSFDNFHESIYKMLHDGKDNSKAEFALDLIYAIDPKELTVPDYIDNGLNWLQSFLDPEI